LAECRFRAIWATGRGPWASVSFCPRGTTVQLYETEAEARQAKATIDATACGGACIRDHRVVDLRNTSPVRPRVSLIGGPPQ
jgi:hypothetical protein